MPASQPAGEPCRKHGVVLTCFLDGKKLFRAVPADQAVPADTAPSGLIKPAGRRRNPA